jgi:hypothetical protein
MLQLVVKKIRHHAMDQPRVRVKPRPADAAQPNMDSFFGHAWFVKVDHGRPVSHAYFVSRVADSNQRLDIGRRQAARHPLPRPTCQCRKSMVQSRRTLALDHEVPQEHPHRREKLLGSSSAGVIPALLLNEASKLVSRKAARIIPRQSRRSTKWYSYRWSEASPTPRCCRIHVRNSWSKTGRVSFGSTITAGRTPTRRRCSTNR